MLQITLFLAHIALDIPSPWKYLLCLLYTKILSTMMKTFVGFFMLSILTHHCGMASLLILPLLWLRDSLVPMWVLSTPTARVWHRYRSTHIVSKIGTTGTSLPGRLVKLTAVWVMAVKCIFNCKVLLQQWSFTTTCILYHLATGAIPPT